MTEPQVSFVDIEGARALENGIAVVIDVMRAYTMGAWALHLGARELVLVDDMEEAVAIAATIPGALLAKDGVPDPRFDLHNSPALLPDHDLTGRTIVQRTNAGTRAAVAARNADRLLCASFVCASATATAIHTLCAEAGHEHVTFVVSGGLHAEEDLACAELIAAVLSGRQADPQPFLDRAHRSDAAEGLRAGVAKGHPGVSADDIAMCLEHDRFDFAMEADRSGPNLMLRPMVHP